MRDYTWLDSASRDTFTPVCSLSKLHHQLSCACLSEHSLKDPFCLWPSLVFLPQNTCCYEHFALRAFGNKSLFDFLERHSVENIVGIFQRSIRYV